MPLLIVTGYPSSGKSTTAKRISDFLKEELRGEVISSNCVKIISDSEYLDDEGRDSTYMSISEEKQLRGFLKSEVQRSLMKGCLVILDASVYIKGFRYELFCICKEANTQYCVVEKLIDPETCWSWNLKNLESKKQSGEGEAHKLGYKRETFDALLMRYEECDATNRWEFPLFKITKDDELNWNVISDIMIKGPSLEPNMCTSFASSTTTIYKKNNYSL